MWEQIASNQRKSVVLVVLMAALLFVLGYVAGEMIAPGGGGYIGLFVAFLLWGTLTLIAYYQGSQIFLGLSRARKIRREDHPRLWNVVEEMKIASGLPFMPDVYIIDDPSPNAFATGRSPEHCAVAVTTGLLKELDRNQLQGVLAHEVAHIQNRDVLLMIMLGVMLGTIVLLADLVIRAFIWGGAGRSRRSSNSGGGQAQVVILIVGIVLMILAPILAQLIYFAVSRRREYLADACAVQFTRYPEGLASALETISRPAPRLKSATRATAPMYIINPMHEEGMAAHNLSATHPPIQDRVRILRNMAGAGLGDYDAAFRQVTRKTGVIPREEIKLAEPAPIRAARDAPEADASTPRDRAREAGDALLSLNDYVFLSCACGNKLKVPPEMQFARIKCPTCGRQHKLAG
jgi:heat shock protein HtpX